MRLSLQRRHHMSLDFVCDELNINCLTSTNLPFKVAIPHLTRAVQILGSQLLCFLTGDIIGLPLRITSSVTKG